MGLHVLARKIIFVDLALAQSAAFGMAISLLVGWEPGSLKSYLTVLSSALIASVLFTLVASKKNQVSQEAFIGIIYAFFSVLVILLFDKAAHGSDHIKHTLTGHLIWTSWSEVLKVFLIYISLSIVYFFFHKKLWESSIGQNRQWKWNFLFYTLFSFVIASSVSIVGVLLVFSFLIVHCFFKLFFIPKFFNPVAFWLDIFLLFKLYGFSRFIHTQYANKPFYCFSFYLFAYSSYYSFFGKKKFPILKYLYGSHKKATFEKWGGRQISRPNN